jgi:hypothetical protein
METVDSIVWERTQQIETVDSPVGGGDSADRDCR